MRLNDPFPALLNHANTHDIYKLVQEIEEKQEFEEKKENLRLISNIPFPLILIQVYRNLPEEKRNRNGIKEELTALKEKLHENYRDNFNEALSRIYDLFQTSDNFMIDINLLDHHLT